MTIEVIKISKNVFNNAKTLSLTTSASTLIESPRTTNFGWDNYYSTNTIFVAGGDEFANMNNASTTQWYRVTSGGAGGVAYDLYTSCSSYGAYKASSAFSSNIITYRSTEQITRIRGHNLFLYATAQNTSPGSSTNNGYGSLELVSDHTAITPATVITLSSVSAVAGAPYSAQTNTSTFAPIITIDKVNKTYTYQTMSQYGVITTVTSNVALTGSMASTCYVRVYSASTVPFLDGFSAWGTAQFRSFWIEDDSNTQYKTTNAQLTIVTSTVATSDICMLGGEYDSQYLSGVFDRTQLAQLSLTGTSNLVDTTMIKNLRVTEGVQLVARYKVNPLGGRKVPIKTAIVMLKNTYA